MSLFAIDFRRDISIEDETITIQKLSLGDQVEIAKKVRVDDVEGSVMILSASIKAWSLKGSDGNLLPINRDNILKIRMELIAKITEEVYKFNNLNPDQLKNL
jgi:hypothetical protein